LLVCVLAAAAAYLLFGSGRVARQPSAAEATQAPLTPTASAGRAIAGRPTPPPDTPAPPAQATWIKVYFTTPKYPDNPTGHHGGLDEKLTAFIGKAQKSVDMAIYQLDLPNVTQALLDAKGRGAAVRVVTDVDTLSDPQENPSFKQLQKAGIPVVAGNPNGIMHDKFVVVDGSAVWTGSWNFTTNDTYRYNNNGAEIQSPALAHNYTVAFEKRFKDKRFGAKAKPGGTTPVLTIGGDKVENYFAGEDEVTRAIVARINQAQTSIDFLAFSFTEDSIGQALLARARAGVKVRGVFETTGSETKYSQYGPLKAAGQDVWQDGNPYLMHHKVFVLDGKTVVFGSFNFSGGAQDSNDENLLIVDDAPLAT
jgi:phosphatidylserine/phosphatidylglycerophosphate/cardiolipin synthase-like enzyme